MKWKEPATIAESNFDSARPTKFIVHGFIDTYNNKWVKVREPIGIKLIESRFGGNFEEMIDYTHRCVAGSAIVLRVGIMQI